MYSCLASTFCVLEGPCPRLLGMHSGLDVLARAEGVDRPQGRRAPADRGLELAQERRPAGVHERVREARRGHAARAAQHRGPAHVRGGSHTKNTLRRFMLPGLPPSSTQSKPSLAVNDS